MRKIDKQCTLSTNYRQWEQQLTSPHPDYTSSRHQFYKDIVTQLLACQEGLCAYTERRLCAEDCYNTSHWANGIYQNPKPEFEGELDHFDPTRKTDEAWAWDNFFVVSTHINQKIKGKKRVDYILKPDAPQYDPFRLLAYNPTTHLFTPNPTLTIIEQERIQTMIDTLGINFGPIVRTRQEYLNNQFKLLEYVSNIQITQFPTAYNMITNLKENNEQNSILDSL